MGGKLTAFRVNAEMVAGDSLAVEGKPVALRREGGFCSYGSLPQQLAATPAPPGADRRPELAPALQYWLLPDEVHLSALKEADAREITLHLRLRGSRASCRSAEDRLRRRASRWSRQSSRFPRWAKGRNAP